MELDIKRGTKGLVTAPGVLRLAEEAAKTSEGISVYLSKLLASGPGRGCWDSETTARARRWKTCQGFRLSEDIGAPHNPCLTATPGGREGHPLLAALLTSGSQRDAHNPVSCLGSGPAGDTDLRHPHHPGHLSQANEI